MKRYYFIFKGQVQGVGFRSFVKMKIANYKITGWIRNMQNGCVELELQGKQDDINTIFQKILAGNPFIRIDDYHVKEIDIVENETSFSIHY